MAKRASKPTRATRREVHHGLELRPITRAQFEILDDLAEGHAPTRTFLTHVAQRQLARRLGVQEPRSTVLTRWVEVPSAFVRSAFPGARWKGLTAEYAPGPDAAPGGTPGGPPGVPFNLGARTEDEGPSDAVLRLRNYSTQARRCRAFGLVPVLMKAFIAAGPRSVYDLDAVEWVDPLTGRPTRALARSRPYDRNRRPYPPLVVRALKAIKRGRFDAAAVEGHLRRSRERLAALRGAERWRAERRHWNDAACYAAVLRQRPVHVGGGAYAYGVAYRVGSSGRLFEVGGGLQGATREMKAAAYGGVPGVRNYDLRQSQLRALRQLMEEAALPHPCLAAYLDDPAAGARGAEAAGVGERAWKEALYACLFGSPLYCPPSAFALVQSRGWMRDGVVMSEVTRVLLGAAGKGAFPDAYDAFYARVAPIEAEVARWRLYVIEVEAPSVGTRRHGDLYLANAVGMKKNLTRPFEEGGEAALPYGRGKAARVAAAHLLQGLESAFVHALTAVVAERGLVVLSNEHDGLVVAGTVTEEDVAAARAASGFRGAELAEKPFVSGGEEGR